MPFTGGGTYNVTVVTNDITQNNGMAIVDTVYSKVTLSGLQDIEGVTGADGVRVLLEGMDDPIQNGIWVMHSGSWTRATDMAAGATVTKGALVQVDVLGGCVFQGVIYVSTTLGVVGTDALYFQNENFGAGVDGATEESGAAVLNTGSYLSLNIGEGIYTVALVTVTPA